MFKSFLSKIKESSLSILPITIVALIVILIISPKLPLILGLIVSAFLLIIGIALFSMGANSSMIELGDGVGGTLSKRKSLVLMLLCAFVIGFIITFAEPDLLVLARQVINGTSLNSVWLFIAIVSFGVGIMLVLGLLRIVFKIKLSYLLLISYSIVIILSLFVPKSFVAIAFDSGSVTTGPLSVPFLISFGMGISAIRSSKGEDDSFGLIALCSVGPIITVLIMGLFVDSNIVLTSSSTISAPSFLGFLSTFLNCLKEVIIVFLPILLLFLIFQLCSFKYPKTKVFRMIFGFFLTYIGIVIFLTGVECGYLPIGVIIGQYLFSNNLSWVAIPLGVILGAFAISAEPAMHVLKKQVEDLTSGAIKQKVIVVTISIGVALSVAVSSIVSIFNIDIRFILLPVYLLCLVLMFTCSKIFTAVAFDSGGVATGTMAVSFILPFISGISATGSGFGTISLISLFPILCILVLGTIYKASLSKKSKKTLFQNKPSHIEIVEFDYKKAKEEFYD